MPSGPSTSVRSGTPAGGSSSASAGTRSSRSQTAAIAFYEHHGYERVGEKYVDQAEMTLLFYEKGLWQVWRELKYKDVPN